MMDELIRVRCPGSEKALFTAASIRSMGEGKLSEWVRQACREKAEQEMGTTIGVALDQAPPSTNGDGAGHGNFERRDFSWD